LSVEKTIREIVQRETKAELTFFEKRWLQSINSGNEELEGQINDLVGRCRIIEEKLDDLRENLEKIESSISERFSLATRLRKMTLDRLMSEFRARREK
jgi:chromosome segregation ATPase